MDQVISDYIKNKRALVVEDEPAIAQLLKMNLIQMGFEVHTCANADAAMVSLKADNYQMCLVDWMLPTVQGIDFVRHVRPQYPDMKIMMVTAKADADSIVAGLEVGADDYLTKPFDAKVLAARVRHLMRRSLADDQFKQELRKESKKETDFPSQVTFDQLTVHFAKHIVSYAGADVHLTPSEFKLLSALIKARGQVLTRDQLINLIQGEDVTVTGRTIDTHIFALRKKIGTWSKHIETIRGVGYRILISVTDVSEPEVL